MSLLLFVAVAVAGLVGCSGSGDTGSPSAPPAEACQVLDRQTAEASTVPVDLIGLDRAGIDQRLGQWEQSNRELSAADAPGRKTYDATAELVRRARPLVVERWGEGDGTALEGRAYRNGRFDVVAQALEEAGQPDEAERWTRLRSIGPWVDFRLATGCHATPPTPIRELSATPAGERPPLPLLALDTAAGGQLKRVATDGMKTVGPAGLRLFFPALSPDRETIVAFSVTGSGQERQIRTISPVSGTIGRSFGEGWACAGWFADGTLVLGRRDGIPLTFEVADRPGQLLPIRGGDCPTPGTSAGEVLLTQGQPAREEAWVAGQRTGDGTVTHQFRQPGCNLTSAATNPTRPLVVFAAACVNPLDRGLWTATPGGELTHILTCVCGVPTFSPDGQWLAYAIVPVDGDSATDTRLGFAHPDGSNAFHLPEGRLSFPLWTPPKQ